MSPAKRVPKTGEPPTFGACLRPQERRQAPRRPSIIKSFLFLGLLFSALLGWGSFVARFGRALLGRFGGGFFTRFAGGFGFAFSAVFLLLLDHFHFANRAGGGFEGGGFLGFG